MENLGLNNPNPPPQENSKIKWIVATVAGVLIIGIFVYLFAGSNLFKGQIKLTDQNETVMKELESCVDATQEELTTNSQIDFTVKEGCEVDFAINEEYGKLLHLGIDHEQIKDTYDVKFTPAANFEYATSVNWQFSVDSPEIAAFPDKPMLHEFPQAGAYEVKLRAVTEIDGEFIELMATKEIVVEEQGEKELVADIEVEKINDYQFLVFDNSTPTNKLKKATLSCGPDELGKYNFDVNYLSTPDPLDNPFLSIKKGLNCNYKSLKGGKYTITYKLFDENGLLISEEKYELETPENPDYISQKPTVPNFECPQDENRYLVSCFSEPPANGINMIWNYIDLEGKTVTLENVYSFDALYQKAGTFPVTLTVSNKDGSETLTKDITLETKEGVSIADIKLQPESPYAVRVFDISERNADFSRGILYCTEVGSMTFSEGHIGQTPKDIKENGQLCEFEQPGTYNIEYAIENPKYKIVSHVVKEVTVPFDIPAGEPEAPVGEPAVPPEDPTEPETEPETPTEPEMPSEPADDSGEVTFFENFLFTSTFNDSIETLENLINPISVKQGDALKLITTATPGESVLFVRFNSKQWGLDIIIPSEEELKEEDPTEE